jgi:hypothetical protein
MSALAHGTAGINNKGQVVYAYLASGTPHAWYWSPHSEYGLAGNTVHTIIAACSDTAWQVSEAHDINDDGWIVAMGDCSNGRHALLLTPVECPFDVNGDGFVDMTTPASFWSAATSPIPRARWLKSAGGTWTSTATPIMTTTRRRWRS